MNTLINKTQIKLYKKNIIPKYNTINISNNCLPIKKNSDILQLDIIKATNESTIAMKELDFLEAKLIINDTDNFFINMDSIKLRYEIMQATFKFLSAYKKSKLLKARELIKKNE